jgi:[acyl-carrier-protein] S-malonyltransferase
MISIACPGQGSQSPGFLASWLELPQFARAIAEASEILKLDLKRLGTEAEAEEIKDTKIAQPLIVAAGIASYELIKEKTTNTLFGFAGHSVGEVTAAALSGILERDQALEFVKLRGEQMALAAALKPSSMAAIIGGDSEAVLEGLLAQGLTAANFNGPGQIVAAGSAELINQLVANPLPGTRTVALSVAGAFHTDFMTPATAELEKFAAGLSPKDPAAAIWTNSDGSLVTSGSRYLELLVSQVSNPVRWDQTMHGMLSSGVTAMIELLPGGALSGIAKRAMAGVEAVALKTPADLEKAIEVIERHS